MPFSCKVQCLNEKVKCFEALHLYSNDKPLQTSSLQAASSQVSTAFHYRLEHTYRDPPLASISAEKVFASRWDNHEIERTDVWKRSRNARNASWVGKPFFHWGTVHHLIRLSRILTMLTPALALGLPRFGKRSKLISASNISLPERQSPTQPPHSLLKDLNYRPHETSEDLAGIPTNPHANQVKHHSLLLLHNFISHTASITINITHFRMTDKIARNFRT